MVFGCSGNSKKGLSFDFYKRIGHNKDVLFQTILPQEIEIVNWSKQQFKILNSRKAEIIDSTLLYNSLNSHINVQYNGETEYPVSIISTGCASEYNYKSPSLSINKNHKIFNENLDMTFIFHNRVDDKIIIIKNQLNDILDE